MMKWFLSAKMYAEAPNQTLSESDWELRKPTIFLKSVYFQATEGGSVNSIMEKVCECNCYSMFELILYINPL